MNPDIYFFSFFISLVFTGIALYLIRGRKLREQYAILWLVLGVLMTLLSVFPELIDLIAASIHVSYAPSLLYLTAFVAVLFLLLHLSMAVSSLTSQFILLTQTLALLEQRHRQLLIDLKLSAKEDTSLEAALENRT
jgi:hypothetical protein